MEGLKIAQADILSYLVRVDKLKDVEDIVQELDCVARWGIGGNSVRDPFGNVGVYDVGRGRCAGRMIFRTGLVGVEDSAVD